MPGFHPRHLHAGRHAVEPVARGQALDPDRMRSTVGQQRQVAHPRRGVGFVREVHVVFLKIVAVHQPEKGFVRRVGRLGDGRVLEAKQKLPRALPSLVAFEGVFRVESAEHVPDIWGSPQDVQAIVCRAENLHVVDQRALSASCQLKQVRFVAIHGVVPTKVGAAVPQRHVLKRS